MRHVLDPPRATPPARPGDPRVGDLIQLGAEALVDPDLRCALVGFPSDEGVRRNGGRTGARRGPAAIRDVLYRLTPDAQAAEPFTALCQRTVDLGDVPCTGTLGPDQEALGVIVGDLVERGIVPIVLGGGHETSVGHFLGHVRARQAVHVVNVDAHADVRDLVEGQPHSGSPFRQILEHPSGLAQSYTVVGLQPSAVAADHVAYVRERGGRVVWRDDATAEALAALFDGAEATLASFDLDAVDGAFAPGVSAPSAWGLDRAAWLTAWEAAGASPGVRSLDLVELNPDYDADGRTARLAALSVWHGLRGLARRR